MIKVTFACIVPIIFILIIPIWLLWDIIVQYKKNRCGCSTGVTEIWGPPQKRGPPSPYLREIWGSLCKYRDPSCRAGPSFFSLWLNFEMAQEGRFLYKDIYNYIEEGIYPENKTRQACSTKESKVFPNC